MTLLHMRCSNVPLLRAVAVAVLALLRAHMRLGTVVPHACECTTVGQLLLADQAHAYRGVVVRFLYRQNEESLVALRRQARSAGNFFKEPEAKIAVVVRIRGINQVSPKVKKILQLLRLTQVHSAVFVRLNSAMQQMLTLVTPYIAYGYVVHDGCKHPFRLWLLPFLVDGSTMSQRALAQASSVVIGGSDCKSARVGAVALVCRVTVFATAVCCHGSVTSYPNLKTTRELIYKRGFGKVNKQRIPLVDNAIIEKSLGAHGIVCIEDVIHEIFTCGPNFKAVSNFLWPFHLASATGGFSQKKRHYNEGGDAGNREGKINELVQRML